MAKTIEEVKDLLIARCDPEDLLSILEPDIEDLVEGCHEIIDSNMKKVLIFLGETDL